MAGAHTLTNDVDLDMKGLLAQVWHSKLLILLITGIAGALLFLTLTQIDPRYRSDARIIIEKQESVFTRRSDGDFTTSGNPFDEQGIGSQVQVLSSDELALKVIAKLNLLQTSEFNSSAKPSVVNDIKTLAGGEEPLAASVSDEERALRRFRERLNVYAPEDSRVIVIEFWANDPQLAQQVPNALADAYLEFNKQAKLAVSREATGWLGTEIEELRSKVRESEAKVAEYRSNSDILVGNNNALLATQQLSEVSSELSRLRGERSAAEAKADSVRAALNGGGSLDVIPEVISSPLIQRLRERQIGLQAQISDLETTLLPNHPRLKALKSQLGDFDRQITSATSNILTSLERNMDLLTRQETVLLEDVNRLKAEAARVGEAEVELRALEREATAQRELLQSYLTQFREAASRQNSEYLPVDARIISRAVLPSKSFFPKVMPFTIAGTLAVLVLTIVGVLAWALMTGKALKPVGSVEPSMVPEKLPVAGVEPSAAMAARPASADMASASSMARQGSFAMAPDIDLPIAPSSPANVRTQRAPEMYSEPAPARPETARPASNHAKKPASPEPVRQASSRPASARPEVAQATSRPIAAPMPSPATPPAPQAVTPPAAPSRSAAFSPDHTIQAVANLGSAKVAVLSPGGDAGSALTWRLARALAANGSSVLVADLTGSAATSQEMLGRLDMPGLRELLAGTARFENSVFMDRASSVHVLAAGNEAPGGQVKLDGLAPLADAISASYDYVIFDCGPAGAVGLDCINDREMLALISEAGAGAGEAEALERQLLDHGYGEAVVVAAEAPQVAAPMGSAA